MKDPNCFYALRSRIFQFLLSQVFPEILTKYILLRDLFSMGARGALHPWFSETPILAPVVFFGNQNCGLGLLTRS